LFLEIVLICRDFKEAKLLKKTELGDFTEAEIQSQTI